MLEAGLQIAAWVAPLHRPRRPQDRAPLTAGVAVQARVVALGQGLSGSAAGVAHERGRPRAAGRAFPRLLLAAADLFSLTSAWEALPFCVLEATQGALPAVAYDVGTCGRRSSTAPPASSCARST